MAALPWPGLEFMVDPDELVTATYVLAGVGVELSEEVAGGDLGSPALEGALGSFAGRSRRVSNAFGEAVMAASVNLDAAAGSYLRADQSIPPRGG